MLQNKPIAFIDVETTGLIPGYHEIIEISIIKPELAYHKKIKPVFHMRIDNKAIEINGYKDSEWRYASNAKETAQEIAEHLKGHIIIGHNPRFDIEFIQEFCHRENVPLRIDPRAIDTTTIAYLYLVPLGLHSLSLDSIRYFLGWKVHKHHDAYQDSLDTKRLYETLSSPWGRFKIYLRHWLARWK